MANLFLAGAWAILAATFFVWQAYSSMQDRRGLFNPNTAGWAALIMTAYNVVRWWSRRTRKSGGQPPPLRSIVAPAPTVTDPQFKLEAVPDSDGPSKKS